MQCCSAAILILHERVITLVFWHQRWLVGDAPSFWNLRSNWPTPFEKRRLRQISAYNVSTVRDSEKSSIMMNRKLTMGFPVSYRWSAYVTPKSPKEWLKKRVLFKIQFQSNKVSYKVSLCENFQRQNFSIKRVKGANLIYRYFHYTIILYYCTIPVSHGP